MPREKTHRKENKSWQGLERNQVSFLYIRPVWPALLCVIGATPVTLSLAFLAGVTFVYSLASQGPYFADVISALFGLLVPGLWLFVISLLLLLDGARTTVWGILAAASFGIASIFSFLVFAQILTGMSVGSLSLWIVVPVFAGPILGLIGAVWALLWKQRLPTVVA